MFCLAFFARRGRIEGILIPSFKEARIYLYYATRSLNWFNRMDDRARLTTGVICENAAERNFSLLSKIVYLNES